MACAAARDAQPHMAWISYGPRRVPVASGMWALAREPSTGASAVAAARHQGCTARGRAPGNRRPCRVGHHQLRTRIHRAAEQQREILERPQLGNHHESGPNPHLDLSVDLASLYVRSG
jgi:hypothetical protein